ncbi:hypothetical protein CGG80_16435 [Vibrio parahaemolyticus]|nr:hypothetical protein [Vibrio cholerae]EGR4324680.1 hypothetical protein [Vibrio cholerae]TOQ03213.1 hypothetical protein CGH03_22525 [Vibrio parahaemolyticus]TOR15340.1 hypothetical protein CGG80_16435 [Vibrio parahaemolyticus]
MTNFFPLPQKQESPRINARANFLCRYVRSINLLLKGFYISYFFSAIMLDIKNDVAIPKGSALAPLTIRDREVDVKYEYRLINGL